MTASALCALPRQEGETTLLPGVSMPALLLPFRARTPIRDALRRLRRWLNYRPERAYMRGNAFRA